MNRIIIIALSLLAFVLLLATAAFADGCLIRGTAEGELYVYGVSNGYGTTTYWLYRSADYGQTFHLQNDTVHVAGCGLSEGANAGGLYKTYSNGSVSYSDNYGVDFVQKNILGSGLKTIASGYTLGEVYASKNYVIKYSPDYGETFVDTGACLVAVQSMTVGHAPGKIYCGCDGGQVHYSIDYGQTLGLITDVFSCGYLFYISKGTEPGEIYFYCENNWLYYGQSYADTVYKQYHFDFIDGASGLAGGFSPGEVYVLETVWQMMGQGDTYIHRSTDYGQTFIPYHVSSNHDDTLRPEAIDDLSCTPSDSSILLTWSHITKDIWSQTEEVPYYVVYRNLDPDFMPSTVDSIGYTNVSSYLDANSRWSNQAYYYVVKAVDDSGNKSGGSNKVGKVNKVLINE